MLGCRNIDSPMDINTKMLIDQEKSYDVGRYRRLVEKLNYLTVTILDNTFAVSIESHYMSHVSSRIIHLEAGF